MLFNFLWIVYLVTIAASCMITLMRFSRWDPALKILSLLMPLIFIAELLNYLLDHLKIMKSPVSHIFSIFELSITTVYFLFTNWRRPSGGSIMGVCLAALLIGLADMRVQSLYSYNTIMLMLESISISAMALFSLYRISFNLSLVHIRYYPHFVIWTGLLILWTSTFFFWVFLTFLKERQALYDLIGNIQLLVCIIIYGSFAVVFYRADFRKLPLPAVV